MNRFSPVTGKHSFPSPSGRHPYRMDGCTYSIPNDEHYPCYTFGELLLTLGDTTLSSASPENKLYLPADGKEQELSLLVHDLLPMPGLETHDVGLYLYKEPEPEPLCCVREMPDDENDIFINLVPTRRHPLTGRYFLLVVHADYPHDAPCRDKMADTCASPSPCSNPDETCPIPTSCRERYDRKAVHRDDRE